MEELLQSQQAENIKSDQQQDAFLDNICQNFKGKQEQGLPHTSNKLAEIKNQFFKEPLTDEKMKKLLNEYSRPANCNFAKSQLRNPEIWRLSLAASQQSTDIMLLRVLLQDVKASYTIMIYSEKTYPERGEI